MNTLRRLVIGGMFLPFLLPLVFTASTMFPWHFGKTVLFQILIEMLALGAIFFVFKNKEKLFRWRLLDTGVLIFLGVQILATLFGVDPSKSWWGYQSRAQGVFTWAHFVLFYLLLRQFFTTAKDWKRLFGVASVAVLLSVIVAWVGPQLPFLANKVSSDARLGGLIGNPLFFANFLTLPIFAFLGYSFLLPKNDPWRRVFLVVALLAGITLVFTQIRGAFVGTLAGLLVVGVLFLLYGDGSTQRSKKRVLVIGAVVLVLLAGMYVLNSTTPLIKKYAPPLGRILSISTSETTATTRLLAWGTAWQGFLDKPIVGWGPENFQDAFDRHYNPDFLNFSFAETIWDKPHNTVLEILVTMGGVGLLGFVTLLWTLGQTLRLTWQKTSNGKRVAVFFLCGGVTAHVVQNLFAFETSNSLLFWFFVLAFIAFLYDETVPAVRSNTSLREWQKTLLITFAFFLTIFLIGANVRMYRASVAMGDARDAAEIFSVYQWQKQAETALALPVPFLWEQAIFLTKDMSNLDASNSLNKEAVSSIAPKLEAIFLEAKRVNPESYQHDFWLAEAYWFLGEYIDRSYYASSTFYLEEAAKKSPTQQRVPLLLSRNYLTQGKAEESLQILEELVARDPSLPEPHWFLGLALRGTEDKKRAVAELKLGEKFAVQMSGNIGYLIEVYNEHQMYEDIIRLYKILVSENPNVSKYWAGLAATYAAVGDQENTVKAINRAVEIDPSLAKEAALFLEQNNIIIK